MELNGTDLVIFRAAFLEHLRLAAIPIDYETLSRDGILGAATGGWYEVLDMGCLPEHASAQIAELKSVPANGTGRVFARFEDEDPKTARLDRLLRGKPRGGL